MKKLLLSLVALMAIGAYAQDIKFAMDVVEVRQGASVAVPINVENTIDCYAWEAVIGVQGVNVLNGDVKFSNYEKGERVQNIAYTKVTFDEETGEEIGREDRTDGAFDIPYEPQKQEDGTYAWKITGYNTGGFAMKGNSGAVAYITFTVPETVAIDTEFTGYIKGIHFGKEDGSDLDQEDITFTIKVVENRIVFDEMAERLPSYTAGKADVRVNRTIKAGAWSTICLPFSLTKAQVDGIFGSGHKLCAFDGWDVEFPDETALAPSAVTVNFKSVTSGRTYLVAGTPYLLKSDNDVETFDLDQVTLVTETKPVSKPIEIDGVTFGGSFVGSFVATTIPEDGLFISDNKFWYSTGSTNTKGFRSWLELDGVYGKDMDFGVKMQIDGIVTNINDLDIEKSVEGVYTIDGKKLTNDVTRLPKGVYLINGKKVAVK